MINKYLTTLGMFISFCDAPPLFINQVLQYRLPFDKIFHVLNYFLGMLSRVHIVSRFFVGGESNA